MLRSLTAPARPAAATAEPGEANGPDRGSARQEEWGCLLSAGSGGVSAGVLSSGRLCVTAQWRGGVGLAVTH